MRFLLVLWAALLVMVGCGGSEEAAEYVSIIVEPTNVELVPGGQVPIAVRVVAADGQELDVSAQARWSSNNSQVASGIAGGVRGHSNGDAVLTANFGNRTASVNVKVVGSAGSFVQALRIRDSAGNDLSDVRVPRGGMINALRAEAVYSDGRVVDVTAASTWMSQQSTVATATPGSIMGLSVGNALIGVQSGTVRAELRVTVAGVVATRLAAPPSMRVGERAFAQLIVESSDGTVGVVPNSMVTWSSQLPTRLDVLASGELIPKEGGAVTVQATFQGMQYTTSVSILGPVSLRVDPIIRTVAINEPVTYQVFANFGDPFETDVTPLVQWQTVPPNGVMFVDNVATVTSTGTYTVTATLGNLSAQATLATEVARVLDHIELTPSLSTVDVDMSVQLTLTAHYSDASSRDITNDPTVTWQVTPTNLGSVSNGLFTGEEVGNGTVRAVYAEGISVESSATVEVQGVNRQFIAPRDLRLLPGANLPLSVWELNVNGSWLDRTFDFPISSNDTSVASVASQLVTANNPGTAQLTIGTADPRVVTVLSNPTSLQLLPATVTVPSNTRVPLEVVASVGGVAELVTGQVSFSVSGCSGEITPRGELRMQQPGGGTCTVTASYTGVNIIGVYTFSPTIPVALRVTPSQNTRKVGGTQQLQATAIYSDGQVADVTSDPMIQWTTSPQAGLATATGAVSSSTPGPVTVTASYLARNASATVEFVGGPVVPIRMTQTDASVLVRAKNSAAAYSCSQSCDIPFGTSAVDILGYSSVGMVSLTGNASCINGPACTVPFSASDVPAVSASLMLAPNASVAVFAPELATAAFDDQGKLVGITNAGDLVKLDRAGNVLWFRNVTDMGGMQALDVAPTKSGALYVMHADRIALYSETGAYLRELVAGSFTCNLTVAFTHCMSADDAGNLMYHAPGANLGYYRPHGVQTFTFLGAPAASIGVAGFAFELNSAGAGLKLSRYEPSGSTVTDQNPNLCAGTIAALAGVGAGGVPLLRQWCVAASNGSVTFHNGATVAAAPTAKRPGIAGYLANAQKVATMYFTDNSDRWRLSIRKADGGEEWGGNGAEVSSLAFAQPIRTMPRQICVSNDNTIAIAGKTDPFGSTLTFFVDPF